MLYFFGGMSQIGICQESCWI